MPLTTGSTRDISRAALLAGAGLTALCVGLRPASANPDGATVRAGSVSIEEAGNTLTVHQGSHKAIIDWNSFSIAADELTRFVQPSSSAIALNRVTGGDPSQILGQLQANGQVMLINPNGVLFGAGSRVDVNGLVATTADIANQDFLDGAYAFQIPGTVDGAAIINRGEITVAERGYAALVAPHVENAGVIRGRLARVALDGAEAFTLDLHGDGLIQFRVPVSTPPPEGKAVVEHSGLIDAPGGVVTLSAATVEGVVENVINTEGVIRVTGAEKRGGKVVLFGGDRGTVTVSGAIEARGEGAESTGGDVIVVGEKIDVTETARIDASGTKGGGTVKIGGDLQGAPVNFEGVDLPNAQYVAVAEGAEIRADALEDGDGGEVIVWADRIAAFAGIISARGGAFGGDGGFAEVSGKEHLIYRGRADLTAAMGDVGELLLDPTDIVICANCTTDPNLSFTAGNLAIAGAPDTSNLNINDLTAALGAANVTITTASAGNGTGTVTFDGLSGNVTLPGDRTLTILADDDILVQDSTLSFTAGSLTMDLQPNGSVTFSNSSISTGGGSVNISAIGSLTLGSGSTLDTGGGDIDFGVTNVVMDVGSQIVTGGGGLTGNGFTGGTFNITNIDSGGGDISLNVTGSGSIIVQDGGLIQSTGGDIALLTSGIGGALIDIGQSDSPAIAVDSGGGDILVSASPGIFLDSSLNIRRGISAGAGTVSATSSATQVTQTISGTNISITSSNSSLAVSAIEATSGTVNLSAINGVTINGPIAQNATAALDININADSDSNGAGTLTLNGAVGNANTSNITLTGADLSINANVQGSGNLTLQQSADGLSLGIGAGTGFATVDTSELAFLQDGFNAIELGRQTATAATAVNITGPLTFQDTVRVGSGTGDIEINGDITVNAPTGEALAVSTGGVLTSATGFNVATTGGSVAIDAAQVNAGGIASNVTTNGGDFSANLTTSLAIGAGTIDTGAGNIQIGGTSVGNAGILSTTSGSINITGAGPLVINSAIQTQTGDIAIRATAGLNLNDAIGTTATGPINITLDADSDSTGGGTLDIGGSVGNANVGNINLTGSDYVIGAPVQGSGTLSIAPSLPSTSLGIGTGAGAAVIDAAEIGQFQDGFSQINLGRADATAQMQIGGVTMMDPTTFIGANGAAGTMVMTDNIFGMGDASLTFDVPTNGLQSIGGARIQTSAQDITIIGDLEDISTNGLVLDTTQNTAAPAGARVNISGTWYGEVTGGPTYTIAAGTAGDVTVGGFNSANSTGVVNMGFTGGSVTVVGDITTSPSSNFTITANNNGTITLPGNVSMGTSALNLDGTSVATNVTVGSLSLAGAAGFVNGTVGGQMGVDAATNTTMTDSPVFLVNGFQVSGVMGPTNTTTEPETTTDPETVDDVIQVIVEPIEPPIETDPGIEFGGGGGAVGGGGGTGGGDGGGLGAELDQDPAFDLPTEQQLDDLIVDNQQATLPAEEILDLAPDDPIVGEILDLIDAAGDGASVPSGPYTETTELIPGTLTYSPASDDEDEDEEGATLRPAVFGTLEGW